MHQLTVGRDGRMAQMVRLATIGVNHTLEAATGSLCQQRILARRSHRLTLRRQPRRRQRSLEDCYIGQYVSVADYAQEITEECTEIPVHLQYYIDYERMARDMELNDDIIDIELWFEEHHLFHSV